MPMRHATLLSCRKCLRDFRGLDQHGLGFAVPACLSPFAILHGPRPHLGEAFAIEDASGQRLAFVHFDRDDANDTRRRLMKRLTRDEACRIATNIAKLPTLIQAEAKSNAGN